MTRFVFMVGVMLLPAAALSAPPKAPEELKVRPGQLVRVSVESDKETGLAKNFKDDDAFFAELVSPKGQRQFVFQAPADGKRATFVVTFWTKGETEGTTTTITVDGVAPPLPPGPNPPNPPVPPPTPLPDGEIGLRKVSRDAARTVNAPADAAKLARANRATASAVAAGGAGSTPQTYLAAWREGNKGAGVNETTWAPWGTAAGSGLQAAHKAGKLTTSVTWAAAFNELAAGLDDAAAKGGN